LPDDRLDAWERLLEEGDALTRTAGSAARATATPGSDDTESVRATLDTYGKVVAITVATGWRRQLGEEGLADAVVAAVRDAAVRRLEAWGEVYSEDDRGRLADGSDFGTNDVVANTAEIQRRLQEVAIGPMSEVDRRVALTELLELAQAIERGIDEVSGKLQATVSATHIGQSPDRHVRVTVTGGGEVTDVQFSRAWLRGAHEANIARQITAAFHAAYEQAAAHGVDRLIADSPLGEVQRATQDPFGLARRLRLTD
jgi:DNA-binding protein YbaB